MSQFRPMLTSHGVTEQQWRVIRVLAEEEQLEISLLAERTSILGPSLSRILKNLESKGLLTKKQDKADGRRHWIKINAKGRRLIKTIEPHSREIYEHIEHAITAEKFEQLTSLLQAISSDLINHNNKNDTDLNG